MGCRPQRPLLHKTTLRNAINGRNRIPGTAPIPRTRGTLTTNSSKPGRRMPGSHGSTKNSRNLSSRPHHRRGNPIRRGLASLKGTGHRRPTRAQTPPLDPKSAQYQDILKSFPRRVPLPKYPATRISVDTTARPQRGGPRVGGGRLRRPKSVGIFLRRAAAKFSR